MLSAHAHVQLGRKPSQVLPLGPSLAFCLLLPHTRAHHCTALL
jgi:hypothetical protein